MNNELNKHNQEILAVLKCVFVKKIKTEKDKERLDAIARRLLNKYYFVKHNESVSIGAHVLYINCDKIKQLQNNNLELKNKTIEKKMNINFTGNGYVINDTDGILTLSKPNIKVNNWNIQKKNNLIFKKLTKNELLKMSFEAFLNDDE